MTARAVASASRFASVPELQKRNSSMAGKRSANLGRKRDLMICRRTEIQALGNCLGDRLGDHRIGMTENAGRIFIDEVDIGMAIDIGEPASLALKRYRVEKAR